jgi:hypothetical protein
MPMVLAAKLGLGALSLLGVGGTGYAVHRHYANKKTAAGLPATTPAGAPLASGQPAAGITPPGVPQPGSAVVNLPATNAGPALQQAAAALQTDLNTNGAPTAFDSTVQAFQTAWNADPNAGGAGQVLAVDGLYGAKSQAAFQSCITPAVAPTAVIPSASGTVAPVAVPVNQAAAPAAGAYSSGTDQDLVDAANALVNSPPAAGSNTPTSTFQTLWNQYQPNQQLVVDGEYGPNTQSACQAVLNWTATDPNVVAQGGVAQLAPPSQYGAAGAAWVMQA